MQNLSNWVTGGSIKCPPIWSEKGAGSHTCTLLWDLEIVSIESELQLHLFLRDLFPIKAAAQVGCGWMLRKQFFPCLTPICSRKEIANWSIYDINQHMNPRLSHKDLLFIHKVVNHTQRFTSNSTKSAPQIGIQSHNCHYHMPIELNWIFSKIVGLNKLIY